MISAQTIACLDDGMFDMEFDVIWSDPGSGKEIKTASSGVYRMGDTRSIDLSSYGIAEGTLVCPRVHAMLGDTHNGVPEVAFAANGAVATYMVSGSTLIFSVTLT